jgi:CxxC-x17-CxxC domain-containing protein
VSIDTTLTCRDCGQTFVFTSGELDFYASHGYREPGRCASCRAQRKAERGSGSRDSDGSPSDGRVPRALFGATCASCGQEALVPFQPRGDKPVYCSSCYEQRRGSASRYDGPDVTDDARRRAAGPR